MRPEEFSQMLRNHPGSLASRSASSGGGAADAAKDKLRESFERHSQETRERKERLELDRANEASRIWQEAAQQIESKNEGVNDDA